MIEPDRVANVGLRMGLGAALCLGCVFSVGCDLSPPPAPGGGDGTGTDDGVLHDALSMPAEPTVDVTRFRQAGECAACHPRHFSEWQTSMHAYAMKDPVYHKLVAIRQQDFDGARDQFCTQCHSAIGTRGGEIVPGFTFEELSPITLEGVTCEACHKVVGLERVYNSGHRLDDQAAIHGPIADPVENSYHESTYSPLHDTSRFCGGCHDVVEQQGLNLERPFEEWATSLAAEEGRNCQSCHMPTYTGQAAVLPGMPERENLHIHRFIGVDMPLTEDFIADPARREEIRQEVVALLQSAAELELAAASSVSAGRQLDFHVTVRNLIDAHNLPTGATFNRELWIEVTATDANGMILFQTGNLDANGDLRGHFSELEPYGDNDLVTFSSKFVDASGNLTVFPWKATEHISNSLSPLFERTSTFFIPTQPTTVGPITIRVRLRFRAFPPFLLRALGLGELVERLEIVDIDEETIVVVVE